MRYALSVVAAASAACGTYSLVRPAETLPQGRVELAAGLAASQTGEVNTVLHAAVGLTDDLEVYAHNEFLNTFGEVRYGVLHQTTHDVALAIGAGVGRAITLVSALGDTLDSDDADGGLAGVASLTVGKHWGDVELSAGNRTFIQVDGGFLMSSTRIQLRAALSPHVGILGELGGTTHAPIETPSNSIFLLEGTLGFWVGF